MPFTLYAFYHMCLLALKPSLVHSSCVVSISICMMVVVMNFLPMARSSAIMIVFNRWCVGVYILCSSMCGGEWIDGWLVCVTRFVHIEYCNSSLSDPISEIVLSFSQKFCRKSAYLVSRAMNILRCMRPTHALPTTLIVSQGSHCSILYTIILLNGNYLRRL